ncbi:MAG TPA: hypothetical protein VKY19_01595 [Ktedonosporobacter sp.]|jgi:hypothetical protein|nr:hypothetical protein [Ktedonosporobacter sp.]
MFQTRLTTDQPKKGRRLLPLLSGFLVVAVLAGALVFSSTIRSGAHAAAASTHCATRQSSETLNDGFGNVLDWLRMTTTWCWNGLTVTSHKTVLAWGVTTLGNITGDSALFSPDFSFNCYVASGSNRGCSGNHEVATEKFDNAFLKNGIAITVNEWENYKGQFFSQGSVKHCPGGC